MKRRDRAKYKLNHAAVAQKMNSVKILIITVTVKVGSFFSLIYQNFQCRLESQAYLKKCWLMKLQGSTFPGKFIIIA